MSRLSLAANVLLFVAGGLLGFVAELAIRVGEQVLGGRPMAEALGNYTYVIAVVLFFIAIFLAVLAVLCLRKDAQDTKVQQEAAEKRTEAIEEGIGSILRLLKQGKEGTRDDDDTDA